VRQTRADWWAHASTSALGDSGIHRFTASVLYPDNARTTFSSPRLSASSFSSSVAWQKDYHFFLLPSSTSSSSTSNATSISRNASMGGGIQVHIICVCTHTDTYA
jgi:hypothetical protein